MRIPFIYVLIRTLILHIIYYKAAVLPRILPLSKNRISEILVQLDSDLDYLLSNKANITIDNAPPLYFGFSHGHTLLYTGRGNSVQLKRSALIIAYSTHLMLTAL